MSNKKVKEDAVSSNPVVAYKGFNKDWKCLDFQYAVGNTYEHKGSVAACKQGFHACEIPLDVWNYYPPNSSVFAVVEADGKIDRKADGDSKLAAGKITVKAELKLLDLIKLQVTWTRDRAKDATSGYSAHSATSGYHANSATSGNYANSATSGNYANSATSGDYAHSATSGDYANSATSGYSAHSATSGYYAHSATSGYSAHSATSGNYANSATSGYSAHSATSGYYAHSATSGYSAHSATSGDSAHSATSGDSANSATSGYHANSEAKGDKAIAANAGNGKARAGLGGAIFIVERNDELTILSVFASKVGENGIKPNTWYVLRDGKPVEVDK